MTLKQKQKANAATTQRLLAERALLTTEVKKHEKQEEEEVARVKDLREDLVHLQEKIVREVRELQAELNGEKERVKQLRTALMDNAQAEADDLAKKKVSDEHMQGLEQQIRDNEN